METSHQSAVGTGPDPGAQCMPCWADVVHLFMNARASSPDEWAKTLEPMLLDLRKRGALTLEQLFLAHAMLRYVQGDKEQRTGMISVPTRDFLARMKFGHPEAHDEAVIVACERGCTPSEAQIHCDAERASCGLA